MRFNLCLKLLVMALCSIIVLFLLCMLMSYTRPEFVYVWFIVLCFICCNCSPWYCVCIIFLIFFNVFIIITLVIALVIFLCYFCNCSLIDCGSKVDTNYKLDDKRSNTDKVMLSGWDMGPVCFISPPYRITWRHGLVCFWYYCEQIQPICG